MYKETREAPSCVAQQLAANREIIDKLGKTLRQHAPRFVVTCARGSSGHAAQYAKALIETRLGIPTVTAAPSISSVFKVRQALGKSLFLAISQSGKSPDILMAAQAAKDTGALVVAIVNDIDSPLAGIAQLVIPQHAGPEKSIAATKTFICSLSAIAHLVAAWEQNDTLLAGLAALPETLHQALAQDWSAAIEPLQSAPGLFVVGRGPGLGIAREAALKFMETCAIHAQAFSAAEVRHGPMTLVSRGFPVLVFSFPDQTQASIEEVSSVFIERGAQVITAGISCKKALNLGVASCAHAALRPMVLIQSFYTFVNALALARGLDPDRPPYLNKITATV